MNIVIAVRTVMALLPVISEVVQSVEALHAAESGAEKKKLALDVVRTIYDASSPSVKFDDIYAQLSGVVDNLVTFYNTVGKFVKGLKKAA